MEKDKSKLPERWKVSEKAIRATQWAFDLDNDLQKVIRIEAAEQAVSPSDRLRQILNLDVRSRQTRPRLTLSLNDNDMKILADRYDLDHDDAVGIKINAANEITQHIEQRNED